MVFLPNMVQLSCLQEKHANPFPKEDATSLADVSTSLLMLLKYGDLMLTIINTSYIGSSRNNSRKKAKYFVNIYTIIFIMQSS